MSYLKFLFLLLKVLKISNLLKLVILFLFLGGGWRLKEKKKERKKKCFEHYVIYSLQQKVMYRNRMLRIFFFASIFNFEHNFRMRHYKMIYKHRPEDGLTTTTTTTKTNKHTNKQTKQNKKSERLMVEYNLLKINTSFDNFVFSYFHIYIPLDSFPFFLIYTELCFKIKMEKIYIYIWSHMFHGPVGWGWRRHRLHLYRGVRLPQRVSCCQWAGAIECTDFIYTEG